MRNDRRMGTMNEFHHYPEPPGKTQKLSGHVRTSSFRRSALQKRFPGQKRKANLAFCRTLRYNASSDETVAPEVWQSG